jgi:hypothetical protein
VRAFWYTSKDKIEAMSAEGLTVLDRLGARAKIGFGPASVEGSIAPNAVPMLAKAASRLEKQMRRAKIITRLPDLQEGRPITFFEYEGPTARYVDHDAFWAASVSDRTAVLMVGSARNMVGAKPSGQGERRVGEVYSQDPLGAMADLLDTLHDREGKEIRRIKEIDRKYHELKEAGRDEEAISLLDDDVLAFDQERGTMVSAWAQVLELGRHGMPLESQPRTRGVVLYAGRQTMGGDRLKNVVIGSPLWVEQIAA